MNNVLHRLNLDRADIAELPEGATISCNVTTLRQAADLIKRLAKQEAPPRVDDELLPLIEKELQLAVNARNMGYSVKQGAKNLLAALRIPPLPRVDDEMVGLLREVFRQLHPVMQRTTFHKVEAAIAALTTPKGE